MQPTDDFDDALIKCSRAHRRMGMSDTTAWRRERDDPTFPKAVQIGPKSFAYRASDVRRWINTRPVKSVTAVETRPSMPRSPGRPRKAKNEAAETR